MGRKRGLYLIIGMCVWMGSVSGCVPAPDEVRNEVGLYAELEGKGTDTTNLQYESLTELRKECEQLQGRQCYQFVLPDQILLPEQDMDSFQMGHYYDFEQDKEKVQDVVWPEYDKIPDTKKILYEKLEGYGNLTSIYLAWNSAQDKVADQKVFQKEGNVADRAVENLWVSDKGYFSYEYPGEQADAEDTSPIKDKVELVVWPEREPVPDTKYMLQDGEQPLVDAVAYTEQTVNDQMTAIMGDVFTYKVGWLCVVNKGDGTYYINMRLQQRYKGAGFDIMSNYHPGKYEIVKKHQYLYGGTDIRAVMEQCNKLNDYYCDNIAIPEEVEPVTSYISLASAMNLMAEKITDKQEIQLDDVRLCYTYRQKDAMNLETGERKYDWQMGMDALADETRQARPTWLFAVTLDPYRKIDSMSVGSDMNVLVRSFIVVIDAVDGTYQYYDADYWEDDTGLYDDVE
ncbi:MAG: hypothetical protein J6A03_13490 [Lachnospiraceae bacterium]|nr:hypothetical protein [Lachnospiraceae bacterium]